MAKITLDLKKLVEDGKLTHEEATKLQTLSEPNGRMGILINVFMIIGALAVAAGVIALQPSAIMGLILALVALGGGAILYRQPGSDWRILSHGLIIMGCIGLAGWVGWQMAENESTNASWLPHIVAIILFSGAAFLFKQPFLAALVPLAIGALIGSGTAYWHASYGIFVREASISILLFSAIAGGLYVLRERVGKIWESILTAPARIAFFMVNFAFWVGSLWGDRIGEHWKDNSRPIEGQWETHWEMMKAWREQAIYIPEIIFTLGWVIFLGVCIWLGTRDHRRFLANTSVTFLAIHFYTQLFETLGAEPGILVLAGFTMVGAAFGIARFDNWQKARLPASEQA